MLLVLHRICKAVRLSARAVAVVLMAALLFTPHPASTAIVNGENAIDILGQFSLPPQGVDTTPVYTTGCVNNGASPYGFFNNNNGFPKVALDFTNHWMFASDRGNNRILVFPLNSSTNLVSSKTPSYYLNASSSTSCGTNYPPGGLAIDTANHWLYSSTSSGDCVVNVYNTASMSTGETPTYTIGHSGSCGITQSKMQYNLSGVALDQTNQLLYVSDPQGSRVMVFPAVGNASWGGSGENALYVLGQTSFTAGGSGTTQSTLNNPNGLAYDPTNQLLYVVDNQNDRMMVFPAYGNASWTGTGENALYVVGNDSSSFTVNNGCDGNGDGPVTAGDFCNPSDIAVDAADNLVWVSDPPNGRVLGFSTANWSTFDGESASYVLGQPSFTGNGNDAYGYTSQSAMDKPMGLAYDSTNHRLYVADAIDSRIVEFSTSSFPNAQFSSVTQSGATACAITTNTDLDCWGSNGNGASGIDSNGWGSTEPTGISPPGPPTGWTAVSQGDRNFDDAGCGIAGGVLYCMGNNAYGELGIGNTTQYSVPQQVGTATNWITISTSGNDTCGIQGSGGQGALYCWGRNQYGELGSGLPNSNTAFVTSTSYNGAFGATESAAIAAANNDCATQATAAGLSGTYLAWLAVTTGTDDPNTTFTHSTLPYKDVLGNIVASNWTALVSGTLGTDIILTESGATLSTGADTWTNVNTNGKPTHNGNSATANCSSWTTSASGTGDIGSVSVTNTNWTKDGSSSCSSSEHLYCFSQSTGTNEVNSPVQVGTDTTWTAVSTGGTDTCGIDNGKLYCWGSNIAYEDGQGNQTPYSTPQQVGSATNWIAVSQGGIDTCGIRGSGGQGALYCWGNNANGELGVGSTTQVTTPTQVGSATNWTAISVQDDNAGGDPDACGIAGGALYCMGWNKYGELGLGNTTQVTTPTHGGTATNWTAVSYGTNDTCGIAGGTLYCWGINNQYEDGLGNTTQYETPQALTAAYNILATDEIGQYTSQTSTAAVN